MSHQKLEAQRLYESLLGSGDVRTILSLWWLSTNWARHRRLARVHTGSGIGLLAQV